MGFIESMNKGKFVILSEIDPPKGVNTSGMIETANVLKGRADALLVTEMPSAVMKMGSTAAAYLLNNAGFDAICSFTSRDRNLLALQSDILSASALGIKNIYISEGDDITLGDHPRTKPVNEIDANEFLNLARVLQGGDDLGGNKLDGSPEFNVGTLLNSGAGGDSIDKVILDMEEKIRQGVSFFITPPVFDLKAFEEFIKKVKTSSRVPVIASVILLKSVATARFLNKHVDNVDVPDEIIDRLYSAGDKMMESIAITAGIIAALKNLCEGVNIIALGWEAKIPAFLDAVEW